LKFAQKIIIVYFLLFALQLKISHDKFFKNRLNIIQFAHQRMLNKINEEVDKQE